MVGRTAPQLVALALAALAAGCYETTPHQAQIVSHATPHRCSDAVTDVFSRSGFVQLPTPKNLTMLFGARTGGPYSSFLSTGSGVGVTLRQENGDDGMCRVTIEALSPDAGCAGDPAGPSGTLNCGRFNAPASATNGVPNLDYSRMCPVIPPMTCELTSAPGSDNDAAVDELARRVQNALGPSGRVN